VGVCSGSRLAANRESGVCYLQRDGLALAHFCRTVPRIVGRVRAVNLEQHGAVNRRAECIFDGVQTETLPKSAPAFIETDIASQASD
jgi:hypothetical protein